MTIEELRNKIFDIFEEKGFHATTREDGKISYLGDKWEETISPVTLRSGEVWNRKLLNGYIMDVRNVYRHNGTEGDVSIDIQIYQWDNNSGKTIAKERVKSTSSDKVINKKIDKIIDIYNTL